jgi:hypothetical protein
MMSTCACMHHVRTADTLINTLRFIMQEMMMVDLATANTPLSAE